MNSMIVSVFSSQKYSAWSNSTKRSQSRKRLAFSGVSGKMYPLPAAVACSRWRSGLMRIGTRAPMPIRLSRR
jgi:hypothetical protein